MLANLESQITLVEQVMAPTTVGIYVYDQAEVLDFSGPYEVIATADRFCSADQALSVFLIAEDDAVVTAPQMQFAWTENA